MPLVPLGAMEVTDIDLLGTEEQYILRVLELIEERTKAESKLRALPLRLKLPLELELHILELERDWHELWIERRLGLCH